MHSRKLLRRLALAAFLGVSLILFRWGALRTKNPEVDRIVTSSHVFQHPLKDVVVLDIKLKTCLKPFCGDLRRKHNAPLALRGWSPVTKDLSLGSHFFTKSYLLYQYVSISILDAGSAARGVIVDVAVTNAEEDAKVSGNVNMIPRLILEKYPKDKLPSVAQVAKDNWRHAFNGVWIKRGPYSSDAITAITVLFGEQAVDPRPSWTLIRSGHILNTGSLPSLLPYLSVRRGSDDYSSIRPELATHSNGKLKVLQITDLHFSTGPGECRDPVTTTSDKCQADQVTIEFMHSVLKVENPDFVVFSGDLITGTLSPDSESALYKAIWPVISRKIPFAVIAGNHDDEGSLDRREFILLAESLPYSLTQQGPVEVEGVGNYMVAATVKGTKNVGVSMYFLDTHKRSPDERKYWGYNWIRQLQLDYMQREASALQPAVAGATPRPLSMAFIHIPIPEYLHLDQPMVGKIVEGVTAPRFNTHARTAFGKVGVQVVNAGHDHCNDYCVRDTENKDLAEETHAWLCFGGAAGEGGYGGYGGYVRRVRVFDIDTKKKEITSWKRAQNDPQVAFDFHVMVSDGKVTD